jgi:hypothetical protein
LEGRLIENLGEKGLNGAIGIIQVKRARREFQAEEISYDMGKEMRRSRVYSRNLRIVPTG